MLATYTPTATVIHDESGEAFVKISDLVKVVRQASPQGQYEMFQESYVHAFVRAALAAAKGEEPAPQTIAVR